MQMAMQIPLIFQQLQSVAVHSRTLSINHMMMTKTRRKYIHLHNYQKMSQCYSFGNLKGLSPVQGYAPGPAGMNPYLNAWT